MKFRKITSFPCPTSSHPQFWALAQNQKSDWTMLFESIRAFQNGMTWPGSTKDHGAAPPQAKGLGAGQVLSGGDWARVLPTQKLLDTNLATPASFTPIGPPVQKLVHIIRNTKNLMTNTTTPLYSNHDPRLQQPVTQIKNLRLLKFNIRSGLPLNKVLQKIPPPFKHYTTLHLSPNSKIHVHTRFALSNPYQNGMTWPGSIKNRKVISFQAKGLDAGQGLPRRDWAGVLPTQKLLGTNLATPESFIPIDHTVHKLTNTFRNTESHEQPARSRRFVRIKI